MIGKFDFGGTRAKRSLHTIRTTSVSAEILQTSIFWSDFLRFTRGASGNEAPDSFKDMVGSSRYCVDLMVCDPPDLWSIWSIHQSP